MDYTWFCRVGERQVGPLTLNQVRRMAARGDLKLTSLIRRSDVTSWTEAGQFPDLWPRAAALPPEPVAPPVDVPEAPPVAPPPVAPLVVRPVAARGAPPPRALGAGLPTPPPALGAGLPPPPPALGAGLPTPPSALGAGLPTPPRALGAGLPTPPRPAPDSAATPRQIKAQERRLQARRKLYLLVGATGGIAALVIVIGLVVSAFSNPAPATVANNVTTSPSLPADAVPAASTTSPAPVSSGVVATATPTPVSPATPPPSAAVAGGAAAASKTVEASSAESAALQQILRTTAPWRDASSVAGVSSRNSRLQITGVWFAPLVAGGQETSSPAKDDAPKSDTDPAASSVAAAKMEPAGPRVVCVELHISNPDKAETPLNYATWNLSGKTAQPPVALVDSANHPLAFIPVNKYPDRVRHDKAVRIQPGQGVTDLLVFEAPTGEFEHLRLALRMSALGQGDKYLGFQLPKEMIAAAKPMDVADEPAGGKRGAARSALAAKAGGGAQAEADMMPAEEAPSEPAATAPPPPKEETILDLKRQIEQTTKDAKAEKDRILKKQDEENKKKGDDDQANESS